MNLSYDYIQFLNDKILSYLPAERFIVGDKINFRCPLCGDSRKSITKKRGWWYMNTASYYCWNCGTGMSGIKLLEILSGQDYNEIKREYVKLFLKSGSDMSLSASFETPSDEPSVFNVKRVLDPSLKLPLTDDARQYLNDRKVLTAPFLREDLFSCRGNNGVDYILIPWIINGIDAYYQLNDFKKVNSMKYIFPKKLKKLVYGLDNIDISWNKIIVFEGVYDSLFVKNGIATGTKSITEYQMKLIKERYPKHEIVVSFDNDEPGIASMTKLIKKNAPVKFFRWFNKNTKQKDINDYVLAKDDVNAFASSKVLDKMIYDQLQMKWWLVKNGLWKFEASNTSMTDSHLDHDLNHKKSLLKW